MRAEIQKESKVRYESIEHLESCLENDFPKLQEEIRTESNDREETDNVILRKVNEETQQIVDLIH